MPGSGRKPGTCNKINSELRDEIDRKYKPAEFLGRIVLGLRQRIGPPAGPGKPNYAYPSLAQRIEAAQFLLPYAHPRLGSLDVKVTDDTGTAQRLEAALERMRATLAQPPPRQAQSIGQAPPPSVIEMPADSAGGAVAPPEPRSAIRQSEPLNAHIAASGESGGPILPQLQQVPIFPGWAGMRDADAPWQPSGPAGLSPARTGDGRMVYLGMLAHDPTERDPEE